MLAWRTILPRSSLALAAGAAVAVGCGAGRKDTTIDIVYDPCAVVVEARSSSEAHGVGVLQAIELWNRVASLRLSESGPNDTPRLVLHFEAAASIFHGVYDDERGVIFINDDLEGDELVITAAHELGHAFGLAHVDPGMLPSVMNPNNLTVPPTSADVAKLHALWGTCDAPERSPGEPGTDATDDKHNSALEPPSE